MRSSNRFVAAVQDIREGAQLAPLWWRLGIEQTLTRYRRTVLGPFWIAGTTISTGIAMAVVFGGIFGGDWRSSFPFILGGVTAWALVSGTVVDGTNSFLAGAGIMQIKRLPMSFHVFLQMHKLVINYAHALVAFWLVLLVLQLPVLPHWSLLPGMAMVVLIGLFLSVPLGMVATRYRDIGQMILFVMNALFLLTPVFWRRSQMREELYWIVDYNPFAHLLELVRQPILGSPAPLAEWVFAVWFLLAAMVAAVLSLAYFRRRVVFWL